MVTSFRPKSASLADDSVLLTVRPCSNLEDMYYQWSEYRLELAEERCRGLIKSLDARKRVGRKFDVEGTKADIAKLIKFLQDTADELVGPEVYKVPDESGTDEGCPELKRKRIS